MGRVGPYWGVLLEPSLAVLWVSCAVLRPASAVLEPSWAVLEAAGAKREDEEVTLHQITPRLRRCSGNPERRSKTARDDDDDDDDDDGDGDDDDDDIDDDPWDDTGRAHGTSVRVAASRFC